MQRASMEEVCPLCEACVVRLFGERSAWIDCCGFENYRLECKNCGAAFAGIIDPYDSTLLLSQA
jgi:hypothetical protein